MSKGIKISDSLVELARTEGNAMHRSIGAQVEHWASIGRAIEHSADFAYADVLTALSAERAVDQLSAHERAFYLDLLANDLMADRATGEIDRIRRARAPRYGLDARGRTVEIRPDDSVRVLT